MMPERPRVVLALRDALAAADLSAAASASGSPWNRCAAPSRTMTKVIVSSSDTPNEASVAVSVLLITFDLKMSRMAYFGQFLAPSACEICECMSPMLCDEWHFIWKVAPLPCCSVMMNISVSSSPVAAASGAMAVDPLTSIELDPASGAGASAAAQVSLPSGAGDPIGVIGVLDAMPAVSELLAGSTALTVDVRLKAEPMPSVGLNWRGAAARAEVV